MCQLDNLVYHWNSNHRHLFYAWMLRQNIMSLVTSTYWRIQVHGARQPVTMPGLTQTSDELHYRTNSCFNEVFAKFYGCSVWLHANCMNLVLQWELIPEQTSILITTTFFELAGKVQSRNMQKQPNIQLKLHFFCTKIVPILTLALYLANYFETYFSQNGGKQNFQLS